MKQQQSIPVGAGATVAIFSEGDLRVLAHGEPSVVVLSSEPFTLAAPTANTIDVHGEGDLEVRVPAGVGVAVANCGGDAHIREISGDVRLENCGGDAQLREISGTVWVANCGGDLGLRQTGSATVGNVGGDVRARVVNGPLQIGNAGGDASLSLAFVPGNEYAVAVGGDIRVNLVAGTSATITVVCGGDLTVDASDVRSAHKGPEQLVLVGGGDSLVSLHAGGDVTIRDADAEVEGIDSLAGSIESLVTRQLSGGMRHVTAILEKSGLTIQRSLEEAQRKVEEAERRAETAGRRSRRWGVVIPPEPPRAPEAPMAPVVHEPVSDDERLTILRLVETGKVTAAEAAQLLAALEGK
ncbi:MAG: hypothetical protein JNL73_07820 [Anaerolineales bacterium]|nr:hypothetical protein [Anaerolineales bacterium]